MSFYAPIFITSLCFLLYIKGTYLALRDVLLVSSTSNCSSKVDSSSMMKLRRNRTGVFISVCPFMNKFKLIDQLKITYLVHCTFGPLASSMLESFANFWV